jgi:hypothetical protein
VETTSSFDVTATWNPIDAVSPTPPGAIPPPTFGRGVDGGLDIRWERPSSGPTPTSFVIERQRPDGTWEVISIAVESPFSDMSAILGETYTYRITPYNGTTPGEATVIENVRIPADPRLASDLLFDGRGQPKKVNFAWTGRDLRPGSEATVRVESSDGSTIIELGRVVIGPDGSLDTKAILPRDLAPGSYRLIIEATDAYGDDTDVRYEFDISEDWAPSDAPDPNDGDGSENSDDSSDGDGGMSTMWRIFIYVGVIALLFGAIAVAGWWFIIARRRDEDEDEEQDKIESDTRP